MGILVWFNDLRKKRRDNKFSEEGLTWDELTEEEKNEFIETSDYNKKHLTSDKEIQESCLNSKTIPLTKFFKKRDGSISWLTILEERTYTTH